MNKTNIKKVFIENYKQYYIYKIVDAHGNAIFNAESVCFKDSGYVDVTFVANSTNELYKRINAKIKKIQSYRKAKVLR